MKIASLFRFAFSAFIIAHASATATSAPPTAIAVKGFRAYGGRWQVTHGVLQAGAGPGPKLMTEHADFATGDVGVEVLLPDANEGNAGLILKVSEAGIGADRFHGYEVSLDARQQVLRLARHRQNYEHIEDVPCRVPVGKWFPLVVRMTDTTLTVVVDGKTVRTYEDHDHPIQSGAIGFRPWQREARFRNFWTKTDGRITKIPFESGRPALSPETTLSTEHLPPIAVVVRHALTAPPAVGQDLWASKPRAPGCEIRVIDPRQPDHPAATIFSDPDGCIYDMNVSYDAQTLFFSFRDKDERYWHIWRINTDGSGLKQLTEGASYDVSPCQIPCGDIVFVSTRRFGYTLCQPGPASNLHRMEPDGGNVHCVSMNTLSDFTPQVLADGRVLFTRWEYIDRDLTYRQSLWTQHPDGTAYQLFFGNTTRDVGTFWQARPLPGDSDRVVATFAPHHGFPHGAIGLIDRSRGPEGPKDESFTYITREFSTIGDSRQEWAYRDPFPLDEDTILCSYGDPALRKYRIYLLDHAGNKRLLYEDSRMGCYFPLPLRPTSVPPKISAQVAAHVSAPQSTSDQRTGTFLLLDVYRGLEPTIESGRVKSLRVMEQVRKTEELRSRAYDQSPVMGYGTYYAKRSWGTIPIEEDGSAHFRVPALREIYFQALDAEGRELQRMTSGVQIMPDEQVGCVGCHESRHSSPPATGHTPLAALRPPSELKQPAWGDDGIVDFPTIVQPVLDQYCVQCHGGGDPQGGYDLSGDKTRYFSMAYDNLLGRSRSYRQHNMETGEVLPTEAGKGKPLVHFFWLLRTPSAVNRPLLTGSHASRLPEYLDAKHCGKQIPAGDRKRIYLWIDANVPYYGTYRHARPHSPGRRDLFTDVKTGGLSTWFARDFLGVYNQRCIDCHGKLEGTTDWNGRFAWINLTNPHLSPALTAHLSKESGGRGIDMAQPGQPPSPFLDTTDPDYRTMLNAIETGKQFNLQTPTADMPGFHGSRPEP
ncbi:MAG: DUF1080 domain-containing protein [Fuerstiella sp.]|nr:DUF1080 domain-containing protein [Fuerstiella sp.]